MHCTHYCTWICSGKVLSQLYMAVLKNSIHVDLTKVHYLKSSGLELKYQHRNADADTQKF